MFCYKLKFQFLNFRLKMGSITEIFFGTRVHLRLGLERKSQNLFKGHTCFILKGR